MVEKNTHQLDAVFHAVADRTRRSILRDVARGRKTVGDIARRYPVSLAAISKHVKVLEAAGLVTRERQGTSQLVGLHARSMRPAADWLAFYEQFWTQQLDALQAYLEKGDVHDHVGRKKR